MARRKSIERRETRTMREPAGKASLLLITLMMLACAGVSMPAVGAAPASGALPGAQEASSPFPVVIEHKFGTTVVEREPKRIVSIGYHDHESLLAVGVAPVA